MAGPLLSVVVAVVDGNDALERCLRALVTQGEAPQMEILVPYDPSLLTVESIIAGFSASNPRVRGVPMARVETRRPHASLLGQHELIDQRRSAGLGEARGDLIAMLEDRSIPRADWAASLVRQHQQHRNLAIGGAVENGLDRLLNWAVYYCDFGRYQLPFEAGTRDYLSDVNLTYKRAALGLSRNVWSVRFHEPSMHRALTSAGEDLLLSPEIVVHEARDNLRTGSLLRERFAWGLLYGSFRARNASPLRRVTLSAASPVLPLVLFWRFLLGRLTRRTSMLHVLKVSPLVLLLMGTWATGEATGYLTPARWWHHRESVGRN